MFPIPNLGPIVAFAIVGLLAVLVGIGYFIWWLIQHVRFI